MPVFVALELVAEVEEEEEEDKEEEVVVGRDEEQQSCVGGGAWTLYHGSQSILFQQVTLKKKLIDWSTTKTRT